MNLKQLFADDRAVSPVIGVILMVAITVILAAVIGTFVLGMGDDLQNDQPTASFNMDFNDTTGVTISHAGGDTIDGTSDTVTVSAAGGGGASINNGDWSGTITAGTSKDFTADATWSGETVTVNWESANGDSSAQLASQTAPSP